MKRPRKLQMNNQYTTTMKMQLPVLLTNPVIMTKTFASQRGLGIYPAGSGSFIEESTKLEGQNSASSNLQDLQDLLSSHIDRAQEDSFDFNDVSNEKSADDLNEIPEIRVAGPSNNLNGDTNSFEGEPLKRV